MIREHGDIRLALPIVRPRILERLHAAAAEPITLIIAPAGYGKSVALRQFMQELGERHIRYDVRPEHSTLLGFVRGFADALLNVAPDARKTAGGAEERSRASSTPGNDLAMWMQAHLEEYRGTIAIDDLHYAEADRQVCAFICSLIERTKTRIRWILASRSSLDLPLGSWLAYGQMGLPVDEQDLRFTLEEAREAAAGIDALGDDELAEIVALTGGWPTAIAFALRNSTRSADLRNIVAGTRELTYRYLAEQVYRGLTGEQQELLQFAACLPDIDATVFRAAGYADATAELESLCEHVAFLHRDQPGHYVCHDLFRDFLQHQMELRDPAAVSQIHQRIATALEMCGRTASALVSYARAGSEIDILRLLERHGFDLMEQAHADAVQTAVEALPQKVRQDHAIVLGMRGLHEANSGHFDRAEALLQRAIDCASDDLLKAQLAIRLAVVLINQQRDAASLLEPLRDAALPKALQGEIYSLLAVGYVNAARAEEAQQSLAKAEALLNEIDDDAVCAKVLQRIGVCGSSVGIPASDIMERLSASAALSVERGMLSLASRAYSTLANMKIIHEENVTQSITFAGYARASAIKAGDRLSLQTALIQSMLGEIQCREF